MDERLKPKNRIAELFWLSAADATAKRISDTDRKRLHRALAVGRQRAEAAEALWSNGHAAEGLRLAGQAFEATLETVFPFGEAVEGPNPPKPEAAKPAVEAKAAEVKVEAAKPVESEAKADEADEAKADEAKADEADETDDAKADEAKADEADEADEAKADEAKTDAAKADAAKTDAAKTEDAKTEDAKADEAKPAAAPVAASPAPAPSRHARIREVLGWRGLSPSRLDDVIEVEKTLHATEVPDWDEDVTPKHGELFQKLVSAQRHLDAAMAPGLLSTREIAWSRFTRVGGLVAIALIGCVGSYLAMRTPPGVNVTASGQWSPDYGSPEWAIDGNPNTEWQLPNNQAGWLEITINPAVRVERLRVLNGHNRDYNDRALRQVTIEVYSDGEVARTIDHTWPAIEPRPEWVELPIGLDGVDKIRVDVHSFHSFGGALSELAWE